jgi:PST family polysaccharide transporter
MQDSFAELQQKSSRGIKWQGVAELPIRLFQFATTIILARLLVPDDFGIINMAMIFTQLAYVVFDFGFSSALIQKRDITELHFRTTFAFTLFTAVLFYFIMWFASPLIADYFKRDILESVLKALALIFFLYAFQAIPQIILIRELRFKLYSSLQLLSALAASLTTIVLAWMGYGVWSFVWGSLTEQFILTVLVLCFSGWRPGFDFDRMLLRELASFGSHVLGTRFSAYFTANTPNFVIGRVLGTVQLGYYSVAYQLVEFPVQRISKNVLRVMFPALSRVQDEPDNYKSLYLQTVYHLSLVIIPVFAGLALIAPQFVDVFYGEKWLPVILPLQILTAIGLMRSMWTLCSAVFLSKGRPGIEFGINIIHILILAPAVFFASHFNLFMVTLFAAAVLLLAWISAQYFVLRLSGITIDQWLRTLLNPVIGVAAFVTVNLILAQFMQSYFNLLAQLIIKIMLSGVVYTAVIYWLDRKIFTRIRKFLTT